MKINSATFLISNTDYLKCPSDHRVEFSFIGRSNVGKSSLINMLTSKKSLAKTSSKPGKTQLINHFCVNDDWYLADLPGYGWAKVSKTLRTGWNKMTVDYLINREQLACTFVLIDSRLPPQSIDIDFLNWMGKKGLPIAIIFTKADKLSPNKVDSNIAQFKKEMLQTWEALPDIFITSSVNSQGKDAVLDYIEMICNEAEA